MPLTNHQVRLAARPSGLPRATDWSLTTEEVLTEFGFYATEIAALKADKIV